MTDLGGPSRNGTASTQYDWSQTDPAFAVVEAVSAAAGVRPLDLDSLYGTVDTDALNRVVAAGGGTRVSFTYAAHEVTVAGDGTVTVRPPG